MVNEFIAKALDTCIELGGRILAALVIFIIGKFIVNWLNKLFAKTLERRKVDASIQSFLKSIVNITLLVLLFLAVIGKLGIELTSFAALLCTRHPSDDKTARAQNPHLRRVNCGF